MKNCGKGREVGIKAPRDCKISRFPVMKRQIVILSRCNIRKDDTMLFFSGIRVTEYFMFQDV